MRQKLEIIVLASVDVDEWIPQQYDNEASLIAYIGDEVKKATGERPDTIELEYGDAK